MKIVSLLALLLVSGCASVPVAKTVNSDCDNVAKFAKGIAMLKETGLSETQLEAHISQPTIQPFPITLIRKQIYADNLNHIQAYDTYYAKCEVVGYKQLLSMMEDEDELVRLTNENASLIERVGILSQQVEYLKKFEPKVYVKTKPTPTPPQAVERIYGSPMEPVNH